MRTVIVCVLITLIYRVESRTFCDDQQCVCLVKGGSSEISCSSHPDVLELNYTMPANITSLDMSGNNLTLLRRPLASPTLVKLMLANNQIREIGVDTFNLPSLEILDLSDNELKFIHRDTFAQIKNLQRLNLANNQLNSYGSVDFYHLKSLRDIVLDGNEIGPSLNNYSLFEGGYELSHDIRSLSLSNINLNSDNKRVFMNATNLKILIVSQNNLTELLDLPWSLEYLDVSNNPGKQITRDNFINVVYLRELKLNNILIEEVPDFAFFYLSSLQSLELEGNKRLTKFSPLAWGRTLLRDQTDLFVTNLTLRGSNLTSLDGKLEGIFKKIKGLDLRNNPWKCDCGLEWLRNINITKEFGDIRCSTPQRLFNRSVLELSRSEFVCAVKQQPSDDYLRTSVHVVIYCTLLAITLVMMYFFIFSPPATRVPAYAMIR